MKTKRIALILIGIVAALLIAGSVSLTLALWSDASGGDTGIAPAIEVYDWNAWNKYFRYDAYNASGERVATSMREGATVSSSVTVSYFVAVKYSGTQLSDVAVPKKVLFYYSGDDTSVAPTHSAYVTGISNTVFGDITLNDAPLSLRISPSVTNISAAAFQNLTSLKSVRFAAVDTSLDPTLSATSACTIGVGCFAGCSALKTVSFEGSRSINMCESAFAGCSALTSVSKGSCTLIYLNSTDTSTTLSASNFNTNKPNIFTGCSNLTSPY